jgi:hypothetical protein
MTGRELVTLAGSNPLVLAAVLGVPPLAALVLVLGFVHERGNGGRAPWKYVYALVIYATCLPGMLAAVLTGYTLFFSRENLLDQNVLVYVAPIVAMTVTLMLVRRNVSFDAVPGFDRLWGLMTMIAVTFVIVLAVSKTSIFLFFGGSVVMLIGLCAFIFALLKWGAFMAFRGSREPKQDPPRFGLT